MNIFRKLLKKKKSTLTLLKMLRKHIRKDQNFDGMCINAIELDLSYEDFGKLKSYLFNNRPRDTQSGSYWWASGVKYFRIEWLNIQIEKYDSTNN